MTIFGRNIAQRLDFLQDVGFGLDTTVLLVATEDGSEITTEDGDYVRTEQDSSPAETTEGVHHNLRFTQTATVSQDKSGAVSQTLTFTQTVAFTQTFNRTVDQFLLFDQDVDQIVSGALDKTVNQTLSFAQIVDGDLVDIRSIDQELAFHQIISFGVNELDRAIHQYMPFEQSISLSAALTQAVTQVLEFEQTPAVSGIITQTIEQELAFTSSVNKDTSDVSVGVTQVLTFAQTVSHTGTFHKNVNQATSFQQHLIWQGPTQSGNYGPGTESGYGIGGPNEGEYTAEKTYNRGGGVLPAWTTLTQANTISLEYDSTTITLRSPLLSNRETVRRQRINRKTPGGVLHVFSDVDWTPYMTFRMKFEALTDTERSDLDAFLVSSLGQVVTFVDHESREWDGFIVNPNGEFATFNRDCGHTAEFDFEVL